MVALYTSSPAEAMAAVSFYEYRLVISPINTCTPAQDHVTVITVITVRGGVAQYNKVTFLWLTELLWKVDAQVCSCIVVGQG